MQAIRSTRPGGRVGDTGVTHGVELPGEELFCSRPHPRGRPAPARRFLPQLIDLIFDRQMDPGKVFDLQLPLDQVGGGDRAMDGDGPSRRCGGPRSTPVSHGVALLKNTSTEESE